MKSFLTILMLLIALAILPFVLDWRSPLLVAFRPWAPAGLIGLPVLLILAQIWALRASKGQRREIRVISVLGFIVAAVALSSTLYLECRFRCMRHQVLHAAG